MLVWPSSVAAVGGVDRLPQHPVRQTEKVIMSKCPLFFLLVWLVWSFSSAAGLAGDELTQGESEVLLGMRIDKAESVLR